MATNLTILGADFTNNSAISIRPIIFNHINFKKIYRHPESGTSGYVYIPENELNIPIGAYVGFINPPQFNEYQYTGTYGFVLGEYYNPNDAGDEWIEINGATYQRDVVQTPKIAHTVYINNTTLIFCEEHNLTNHLLSDFGWWL